MSNQARYLSVIIDYHPMSKNKAAVKSVDTNEASASNPIVTAGAFVQTVENQKLLTEQDKIKNLQIEIALLNKSISEKSVAPIDVPAVAIISSSGKLSGFRYLFGPSDLKFADIKGVLRKERPNLKGDSLKNEVRRMALDNSERAKIHGVILHNWLEENEFFLNYADVRNNTAAVRYSKVEAAEIKMTKADEIVKMRQAYQQEHSSLLNANKLIADLQAELALKVA